MAEILLTGCAGFIGSHVCERLIAEGHRVTGIDNFDSFYARSIKESNLSNVRTNGNFVFIEADIRDKNKLAEIPGNFDLVIHLASKAGVRPSIEHPDEYISVNLGGTNNILELMVKRNIKKLIFGSSSSIYGLNTKTPFSETDDVSQQISPYAATKRSAELFNHTYHHLYGIDVIDLRFFTVYGPRQRPDLAICKFFELIHSGKDVPLYGDGSSARDYTFVSDIVDGIMAACGYLEKNKKVHEIINLGNSYPVKLNTLVEKIIAVSGKKTGIQHLPAQAGDVEITFADITKAKKLLGYAPKVSIDDGLRMYFSWCNSIKRT